MSRVRWFSFVDTNVLKTLSVFVVRVVELIRVRWTTQLYIDLQLQYLFQSIFYGGLACHIKDTQHSTVKSWRMARHIIPLDMCGYTSFV